ncbi:MAG TPA: two-component regulator propeller domain-containing protein, partial [Chitinophagaceae bacterium]|nr:two-component regulator propeller domain-containing protein [Chitinophagaceae bacterium]
MKGLYQYIRCLLFLLFFFLTQSAGGQELLFENYSSEQGLSQNSCYAISQDGNGFMWFGTQDGLNRYDGKQFKVYLPQNSTGRKLPSNYISSLSFDKSRNLLWVGTIEGVCLYNPAMDSLLRISELFPYASRIEKVAVKKIVSFRENEYWFITFTNGLLFLNTRLGTLTSFFNNAKERNQVISLVQHEGKIIAGLLHQLFYLHPRGNSYNPEPLLPQYSFPEIRELYSYRGSLWIGTLATGCLLADNLFKPDASVQSFGINKGGIGCFLTDAQGNLWIGTRGDGIIRYNPNTRIIQTSTHNPYDDRSPGKNFVLSLFMDRQGIIWCGLSGSGLAKYDPLKYQIQSIRNEPTNPTSLPDNMIFDVYKCRDGTNYVGTQNKG